MSGLCRDGETEEGAGCGKEARAQKGAHPEGVQLVKGSAKVRKAGHGRASGWAGGHIVQTCPGRLVSSAWVSKWSSRENFCSLPPSSLPGEQIEILASHSEMFFNGLFLFIFQNHPEVLSFRIQLESKELIVNLERNE